MDRKQNKKQIPNQNLKLKGKLQTFLHISLLLGLLLAVVDIWIYTIDVKAGVVLSGFVLFYLVMSLILESG